MSHRPERHTARARGRRAHVLFVAILAIAAVTLLPPATASASGWVHTLSFGSGDGAPGQWELPTGIAVGKQGVLYVADRTHRRIELCGGFAVLRTVDSPHQDSPVAVDAAGRVRVLYQDDCVAKQFTLDATPPVVTCDYDGEWHNTPVPVTFSAMDALAGASYVEWATMLNSPISAGNMAASATDTYTFPAAADHSNDGISRVGYFAADNAANSSTPKYMSVKIDTRPPSTWVRNLPSGYAKGPVTVWFEAYDSGSGVRTTFYSIAAGVTRPKPVGARMSNPWLPIGQDEPVVVSGNGTHTLSVFSEDNSIASDTTNGGNDAGLGNLESPLWYTIHIDGVRPVPSAAAHVSVKYDKAAVLTYKATDAYSPKATVKILIKRGSRLVKTLALGQQTTGANHTTRFAVTLARATYTWYVYATDLAGNTQLKAAYNTLKVI